MAPDNDPPTDPQALPEPPSLPDIRRERRTAQGFWEGTHEPAVELPRIASEQLDAPAPHGRPRAAQRPPSAAESFWDGEVAPPLDPDGLHAARLASAGQAPPGSPIPIRRAGGSRTPAPGSVPQTRKPSEPER